MTSLPLSSHTTVTVEGMMIFSEHISSTVELIELSMIIVVLGVDVFVISVGIMHGMETLKFPL